jgi:hypothetical protein
MSVRGWLFADRRCFAVFFEFAVTLAWLSGCSASSRENALFRGAGGARSPGAGGTGPSPTGVPGTIGGTESMPPIISIDSGAYRPSTGGAPSAAAGGASAVGQAPPPMRVS